MIEDSLQGGIFILVGMLIQIAIFIYPIKRTDIANLGAIVLLSSFMFIPGKHEATYKVLEHLLFASGVFVFSFAIFFRDRLLPQLQEGAILFWNCIFIYAIGSEFGFHSNTAMYLYGISAIMLLIILLPLILQFALKIIAYAWFLFMVTTIGALQFRFADFGVFIGGGNKELTVASAIIDGMAFVYLTVYMTYLFILIPIPGKGQSLKNRIKDWRADTSAMVDRFSDHQLHPIIAIFFMTGLGTVFYLNATMAVINPWLLVNALLVCTPVIVNVAISIISGFRHLKSQQNNQF